MKNIVYINNNNGQLVGKGYPNTTRFFSEEVLGKAIKSALSARYCVEFEIRPGVKMATNLSEAPDADNAAKELIGHIIEREETTNGKD